MLSLVKRRAWPSLAAEDFIAVAIVVGIAVFSPAFLYEDTVLFNYVNNALHPNALYFYNSYVQFIPQVTAYLVGPLPLVVQALLYRAVALLPMVALYRELRILFSLRSSGVLAALLAAAVLCFLRFVDENVWANLSFTIWPAFLAAAVYVMRVGNIGSRYSIMGIAGVTAAALSQPLGILLVPIMLCSVNRSRGLSGNLANIAMSAIIIAVFAIELHMAPEPIKWSFSAARTLQIFLLGFRGGDKLYNVLTVGSLVVLIAAAILAARQFVCERDFNTVKLPVWLCFLGIASIVLYICSPRFEYFEGIPARYTLTVVMCAVIVLVWNILEFKNPEARLISIGALCGFCLALMLAGMFPSFRRPIEIAATRYRFLMAAADFRRNCQPDEALAFERGRFSAVLLCSKRDFPEGRTTIKDFKIWSPKSAGNPSIEPTIYSGKPLF